MSRSVIADILIKAIKNLAPNEQNILINEFNRLEFSAKDVGSRIGGGGGVTYLHTDNIGISGSGLIVYNPVTGYTTVRIEEDGDVKIGNNVMLAADTSMVVFSNEQGYNNETVGAGDLLLGDNTAGASNLFWDRSAGTLNLRAGTTNSIILGTDGVLTLSNALRSMNWSLGVSGFNIDAITGNAEFNDITARGSFTSAVFVQGLIEAHAGTLVVAKSAGVLAVDMVVPTSGTWTMDVDDPPTGAGSYLFTSGDYINAREYFSTSLVNLYFTVGSGSNNGDGTQRYTCTYVSGDRTVERTYTKGLPVTDYGVSGQGYLQISADDTGSPYYSVRTWSGTPATVTERVRIGNMYGAYGTGSNNRYGIGIGDYSGGNYLSYNAETADGFILSAGGGGVKLDSDGISIETEPNTALKESAAYKFVSSGYVTTALYDNIDTSGNLITTYLQLISSQYSSYDRLCQFKIEGLSSTFNITAHSGFEDVQLILFAESSSAEAYAQVAGSGLLVGSALSRYTIPSGELDVYSHTRIGGGLYVGSTGTAPTDGCVHIPSGSLVGTTPANMADDTAISITTPATNGAVMIYRRFYTAGSVYALCHYYTGTAGSGAFVQRWAYGANVEVTTGALTGTTGTDGKFTLSAHTDGKLYFENRIGGTISVHILLLGA